ncbi:hypothetical protein FOCG_17824, partial [Fusarium oxysporum f. sp. radicis-lycopersici 26381]
GPQAFIPGAKQLCLGCLCHSGYGNRLREAVQPSQADTNIAKARNGRRHAGASSLSEELGPTRRGKAGQLGR